MTGAGLALTQAPPIAVPLRFFLSAPLFGIAAAVLLLWTGPDMWATRWSAPVLALTHLVTVGVLAMSMLGALMQMLPVLAASPLPRPRFVSGVAHVLLSVGTPALAGGFLLPSPALMRLAMLALGAGLVFIAALILLRLLRVPAHNRPAAAMRYAIGALLVTVVLGLLLAARYAGVFAAIDGGGAPTDLHVAWGLLGWIGLLVIAVSYQVVPMFQITPDYPVWLARRLVETLVALFVAWSLLVLAGASARPLALWVEAGTAAGFVLFALATLSVQAHRRRRVADVTLDFWRVGMGCLLLAAAAWFAHRLWPSLATWPRYPLVLGMLFLIGFALSLINGMLYKIVPFLVWLHLQGRPAARGGVPNMKQIVPATAARRQFRVHVAALAALSGGLIWPYWFTHLGAVLFALSNALLWVNLWRACRLYRRFAVSAGA